MTPNSNLTRFGVSVESSLLSKFDFLIKQRNYPNRSDAIRELIRNELTKQGWEQDQEIAGAVTILYDHHKRELLNKVMDVQHDFHKIILSSQHIHINHNICFEIIALKGNAKEIQNLTDRLKAIKGIKFGNISMTSITD